MEKRYAPSLTGFSRLLNPFYNRFTQLGVTLLFTIFLLGAGFQAAAQQTWYTLASGNWNDKAIWTLDPAGALPINPSGLIPSLTTDKIVIKNGKTVVVTTQPAPSTAPLVLNCGELTVDGTLDLKTSSGHNFTKIKGTGRILMAGDNFPTGDATHFTSNDQGGGTAVYYGNGFTVSSNRTFCHLEVAMNAGQILTLAADLTLNGVLNVLSGTMQINNATTNPRTIRVYDDIRVANGAKVSVSTANATHTIYAHGNVNNQGEIKLTNLATPTYNSTPTNGSATLYFTGESNNTLTAANTTYLQRLVLDKGNDRSYRLTINATDKSYFRLFGRNNNAVVDKALYIKNGLLEVAGATYIHSLTEGTDFEVPVTGGLWINSTTAVVNSTARDNSADGFTSVGVNTSNNSGAQSFTLNGLFKITAGQFNTQSHGFVVWDAGNALVQIEGGTVVTPGFRSAGGNTGKWTYNQSGGLVQLWGDINSDLSGSGAATFHVKGANNVFIMTGGEMEVLDAATSSNLAITIESGEGNYSVTGGTVRIKKDNSGGGTFNINSSAPFFNYETATSATTVNMNKALVVANDFLLAGSSTFNTNGNELSVGGNFTNNGTYNSGSNTTRFIGSNPSNVSGTVPFHHLLLDKDAEATAVTFGTGTISMVGNLTINQGTLNVGAFDRNLAGNIEITYGNITGTGSLVLDGGSQQTLLAQPGVNPSFGNLKLANSNGLTLLSDVKINSLVFATNAIVNLGEYNLTLQTANYTIAGWGTTRMFRTNGLSSDGGLTLPVVLNGNYSNASVQYFPMGLLDVSTDRFTPAQIFADGINLSTGGFITVKPVNGKHPTTDSGATVLPFYWTVNFIGNITTNALSYRFLYDKSLASNFEKNGSVLSNSVWSDVGSVRTNQTFNFPFSASLEGDFTLGKTNDYNSVRTLYSRNSGDWDSGSTWSLESHVGAELTWRDRLPTVGDRVIIGEKHRINVNLPSWPNSSATYSIGELIFEHDTTFQGKGFEDLPRLQIERGNTMNLTRVSGTGIITQWIDNDRDPVVKGDLGSFVDQKYSWFLYVGTGSKTSLNLPVHGIYPNVATEGDGKKLVFTNHVVINGHLNPRGNSTVLLNSGIAGNLLVNGNLYLGDYLDGAVEFPAGNNSRTLTINGNIDYTLSTTTPTDGRRIFVTNGTGTAIHRLNLRGNLIQGVGVVDMYNGLDKPSVEFCFDGAKNSYFERSGNGTTEFYRLFINKSGMAKVDMNNSFVVSKGAGDALKPFVLLNGLASLNHAAIDLTLSTGGADFEIPSTAELVLNNSTIRLDGTAGTGIRLDGKLTINQDGKALLNGGTNNYIEYTTSGLSTIIINGNGILRVGSQIRRSVNNEAGILKFAQNSADSEVTIGINDASETSRGVFEILNPGSSFTQAAGATLSIMNGQNASAFADFYFDPATVSLGTGSTIAFSGGNATNPVEIYAAKPLQNVLVNNLAQVALKTLQLTVLGNLTIGATLPADVNQYANFDARTLELTLHGDITNNGYYKKTNNITRFKGVRDQAIKAGAAIGFPYFVKEGGRTITVESLKAGQSPIDVNIPRHMQMDAGIINLGGNNCNIQGDANITGKILSTGANGVRFIGTENQTLSGALEADVVTIENGQGVLVPTQAAAIKVNRTLNMNGGILDIGKNLLDLGVNTAVVAQQPFGVNNMIQTNVSFTDAGVRKIFPAAPSTFTYPVGAMGKYTPAVLNITANGNATGSIRIRPANEPHPTILGTTSGVNNSDNVLQYHWVVDAAGISGFSGNLKFYAQAADEKISMPGKTIADYVPARLNANAKWILGLTTEYDETGHFLDLNFSNRSDFDIDGDYTAGLESCIPDVQQYVSVKDGVWTDPTIWATMPAGGTVPDNGPRGSIVTVSHGVTVPGNGISAYRTIINQTGRLDLGNTFAHRLGDVSGKGTLAVSRGDLPAGVYTGLFGSTGGTLEYYGNDPFDVLSEIPAINNLSLKGAGLKGFPNSNVLLYGNLSIENGNVNHAYSNKLLNVKGDVSFTGSYRAGTSTLILSGGRKQIVQGAFIGAKQLYNLVVSNIYGVDLIGNIDVENQLTLSSGVISTKNNPGATLTIQNNATNAISGGSTSSYVEGVLSKKISSGSYFEFPVGDNTRYGKAAVYEVTQTGYYAVRYFNETPNNYNYQPNLVGAGLSNVSTNEFWRVGSLAADGVSYAGDAKVAIRYDNGSGVGSDISQVKVASWKKASNQWQNASATLEALGGGVLRTFSAQSLQEGEPTLKLGIFTLAGQNLTTNYDWTGNNGTDWFTAGNWATGKVPNLSSNVVIGNVTNKPVIGNSTLASCNNLTIDALASLTLAPGSKFQVNGATTVNGNLVLNQDVSSPCSFIHEGAVTGNVQVRATYPATNRNWYVGHPVKTNVNAYNSTSFQVWRYAHSTTAESWVEENLSLPRALDKPMEGFVVNKKADAGLLVTVTHTGVLYQGDQSFTLDVDAKNRWNLVANPFNAYIDPRAIGAIDYGNIESTIWYRTLVANQYTFTTYNVAENISTNTDPANPDNLIAPMQAFWVRATADGLFTIGKNARVQPSVSNPMLKSVGTKVSDVLYLQLHNDVTSDETAVACRLVGSTFYTSIDSDKRLMGRNIPDIYTMKSRKPVTINIQPEEPDTAGIALGFSVTEAANKSLRLVARNINQFIPGMSVFLEDRTTGARIDLRANPEYAFTSDPMSNNSRFVLKFGKISTGVDDDVVAEHKGERIRIFGQQGKAIVLVGSELLRQGPARINIYNLAGSLMDTQEVSETRSELALPAAPAIYLVEVEAGGLVKCEKVVK